MIYLYTAGQSPAIKEAAAILQRIYPVLPSPDRRVTHLLLPVPSFSPDGSLKGGGSLSKILSTLPQNITVIGGGLEGRLPQEYSSLDLLKDAVYLAQNARLTAHCAAAEAFRRLPVVPEGCPVLVLGWGRIGKALSLLLMHMGARVTVYARKESDRAAAAGLGLQQSDWDGLYFPHYRVIFNTVPAMLLSDPPEGPLLIDLASVPGIGGDRVLHARGLPGRFVPESSGRLIARTVLRLLPGKGEGT